MLGTSPSGLRYPKQRKQKMKKKKKIRKNLKKSEKKILKDQKKYYLVLCNDPVDHMEHIGTHDTQWQIVTPKKS